MTEDAITRERLAVVETGFKAHLVFCEKRAEDNTREHSELKALVVKSSDDLGKDIQRVFSRIWWLVGAALVASGSIILAMYSNIGSAS